MDNALESNLQHLREHPFDLLLAIERQLRGARRDTADSGEVRSWTGLAFRLRDRWLVAPSEDVREVDVVPKLTRVPGAKPWLIGVANLRGNLLPVTDLATLLELPAAPEHRNQRVLVLNGEGVPAGFVVDEVTGYRQFAPDDQRHALIAEAGSLKPWLLGAFQRDGRDWLAVSLRKLAASDLFLHAGA